MVFSSSKVLFLVFTALSLSNHFSLNYCHATGANQETQAKKQPDYSSLISELKEKAPQMMAERNVPGLAIALVDGGQLVWAEGFGFTDDSKKIKVTGDTLFSLQSISKIYTATGFLRAVSKGWLKLDDPLVKYLPKFTIKSRFGTGEARKITFRRLLSHRAGLAVEAPVGNNFDACNCAFEDHIKSISDSWLVAPVGERYVYSNQGIDLVGYTLGLRSHKSFERFMKDELFTPLGMNSSTFDQQEAMRNSGFAKGHFGGQKITDVIPMIPSGGMFSSVKDMAKFVSFHLVGGKVNGEQLLPDKLLREMYTIQFPVSGQSAGYGLGLFVQPWYGGTFLNHSGGGYGYSTQQYWMPEYQVGVIVMANAQAGSLVQGIADRALLLMIQAKNGSVPANKSLDYSNEPIVNLNADQLKGLEGAYKSRNSIVTFKVEDGNLFYVSGNSKTKLEARSPTQFTTGSRKYIFSLDAAGRPTGVLLLSQFETEFMPLNDRPGDPAGANKPEWQAFVGEYQGKIYGSPVTTKVFLKNGYLYINWGGGLKLTEYQSGLFFTAEGESVNFHRERLYLGNRPFIKKP